MARSLVRAEWVAEGPPFDATVEEIDVSGLVADATTALNGWLGPRWVRSGWFHAFRMLPAGEQMRLTQLTDDQLAATEGENLPAVYLLLAALKENIAMLPP